MGRATDPELFAESLCKFHAGLAGRGHLQRRGLGGYESHTVSFLGPKVVQEHRHCRQPPREWEAGGQLVEAFSRRSVSVSRGDTSFFSGG